MATNYDNRRFRTKVNAGGGDVTGDTLFHYRQEGDAVWATYSGGGVRHGFLIAKADTEGRLDMRYQHLNEAGQLKTGICRSVPEELRDGRLRVHETWQWTCGDHASGESVIEEVDE
jgi:hypothetical protein